MFLALFSREMPLAQFSIASAKKLNECHIDLQNLFSEVIKHYDCTILEGHRPQHLQDKYYAEKKSKTPWPKSKHNSMPSLAVDAMPYPITWPDHKSPTYVKDLAKLYHFVGYVKATADHLGIKIRCGADWDGDLDIKDQTFDDLPHFELVNPK